MNPHLDYLLKRFHEESQAIRRQMTNLLHSRRSDPNVTGAEERIASSLVEIEYQIRRAFDDQEKEQQKTSSTLDRV